MGSRPPLLFNGDKAFAHVKDQVDIGVRAPGTPGHDRCVEYIVSRLEALKLDVRKLKNLGLTISLRVGYELSPRGAAYLRAAASRRTPSSS